MQFTPGPCPLRADFCEGDRAVFLVTPATQQILQSSATSAADGGLAVVNDEAFRRCRESAISASAQQPPVCELGAVTQPLGHNSPALTTTFFVTHKVALQR